MRKLIILASSLILILSLSAASFGFETDFDDLRQFDRNLPGWKFGRGVSNVLFAPNELWTNMVNSAINGNYNGAYDTGLLGSWAGALNGYVAGIFPGTARMLQRATTGVIEMLTFWKPEYGPTMDPEYGTRCKAFGPQDYFNPNPFWYWGPPRQ
jgi:putative exosortase-associated protein (TIGR04073 family)